jgi:hypothetical protein
MKRALLPTSAAMVAMVAVASCGETFDPASKVDSLRVFAVSKDPSVARPGDDVALRMLWHEPRDGRTTQIAWLGGCWNPEGDLFYGCFGPLEGTLAALGEGRPSDDVGLGDSFVVTVPEDVVSARPSPSDPEQEPYGLGFVFFAACAGTLGAPPAGETGEIPIACYDEAGRLLGSDDFVVGYVEIFAAVEGDNRTPAFSRVAVDGRDVPLDCAGAECVDDAVEEPPIDCAGGDPRCVRCRLDDDDECEPVQLTVVVDPESIEVDPLATQSDGETRYEQTWVRFYADGGELAGDIRIAADATGGPREELTMELVPPRSPGPVRLWLTLHDNRGGATWVRLRLDVAE